MTATKLSLLSNDWNKRFYQLAQFVASWSKDPECQVGAVIVTPDRRVIATGYNGFPAGVPDRYDCEKDEKNAMTIHAELNAILNARQPLDGCILYCTKDPCLECCKAMVQAGLAQVVLGRADRSTSWAQSQTAGHILLNAKQIQVVRLL